MTEQIPRPELLLRRAARVRDEQLAGLAETHAARLLFEEIISTSAPHAVEVAKRPPASVALGRIDGRGRRGFQSRIAKGLATALPLALAVGVVATLLRPETVAAGIEIKRNDGFYIAKVTDSEADREELSATFAQRGLDIELELVAVSPSLVGTIVAIGDEGGQGIETLSNDDRCITGGGSCPIGLRVPVAYAGHAEITLGRNAEPGENYVSTTDPFAPGEALHCIDLYGATIEEAVAELESKGLSVGTLALVERDGRQFAEEVEPAQVTTWYVQDVAMVSAREVVIHASREAVALPPDGYLRRIRQDC